MLIDFPEVGPGWILGPSGPSVSVTTSSGPTSAFGAPSSTTTTPAFIGRHRSDGGAIIGGVIGGIVTISIVVVAVLYFYRRRRRLMMPSPMFEGNIALDPHIHQFLQSTSSQGTVSPCSPETPTSPLRPYVHIFILYSSSSACVCLHNSLFSFPLTLSTWITQLCTPSSK